ncbi:hypothetical protein [Brevibacillus choshinensis]|uniref:Uncharacterized protein n=1 Tax=Brevibacillus choshinensis TaxID=54911 RepID=A0ABX7FP16_BRECH|nr:hypothetical protein [Brevibacillus choshinensis]QRG67430.1 hypothetical protein JNE38_29025 [Brevibacillus choshinensis]
MKFGLVNGLLAGLALAAFLALGDALFGTGTFAVLIDVSYVPGMESLPSVVELLIHLFISVVIAYLWRRFYPESRAVDAVKYVMYWMLAFAIAFLPFSLLSGNAMSWTALVIWVLGHLVFTAVLVVQRKSYRE